MNTALKSTRNPEPDHPVGLLGGYLILDLCDGDEAIAGKLLSDLGAQVIKIEKPGKGDYSRKSTPLSDKLPEPENSLSWQAYNAGKKSVTLDLENQEGRQLFLELVKRSDALIESQPPGKLDSMGLDYEQLCRARPDLILTSITAFGSTGPYSAFKDSDLVICALSGLLYTCGDPDRPPVRISQPQSWLHAGADAAGAMAMALFHRGRTGCGQRVEISALKSMERVAYMARSLWDARGKVLRRPGKTLRIPPLGTMTPVIWQCDDGYVAFYLFGGAMGAVSNPALTNWMDEQGFATETMKLMDWPSFDIGRTNQEEIDREIVGPITKFFLKHTQQQLWDEGVRRRVMVYPVNDAKNVYADAQLEEREFWSQLEHPLLSEKISFPGPFVKTEQNLCDVKGVAPLLGQHNHEIFVEMLGLPPDQLAELASMGAI